MTGRQIGAWRLFPWKGMAWISSLLVAFVVLVYAVTSGNARRELAACRNGYAAARTYDDTLVVDTLPLSVGAVRSKGTLRPLRCGSLRGH